MYPGTSIGKRNFNFQSKFRDDIAVDFLSVHTHWYLYLYIRKHNSIWLFGYLIIYIYSILTLPHTSKTSSRFSGEPVFLHLFEPRYRILIRRAVEGDRLFIYAPESPRAGLEACVVRVVSYPIQNKSFNYCTINKRTQHGVVLLKLLSPPPNGICVSLKLTKFSNHKRTALLLLRTVGATSSARPSLRSPSRMRG